MLEALRHEGFVEIKYGCEKGDCAALASLRAFYDPTGSRVKLWLNKEEQAITVAKDTPFGLCGGIYTADITRALRFARDMQAGQIYISQYFTARHPHPVWRRKEFRLRA